MAVFALVNEYLTINSVNVSDHMKQATLTVDSAQLDSTAMGDLWTKMIGGLKSGQLQVELMDDTAASAIDATLWPLLGTVVPFEVRMDSAVASTSNPKYAGTIFIAQHTIGGTLGELGMKSLTFPTSGVVTRSTT